MAPFFLFDDFIEFLRIEKRYSEHTLVAYQKDLSQFSENMGVACFESLKEVNHRSIRSWISDLNEEGKTNKTINRKLSALRSFFKWLRKQGVVSDNPLAKIRGPKVEKRLPEFVKATQLENTFQFQGETQFDQLRDQLMVEVFYQTGIRLSELINLRVDQVQSHSIKVLGKRNKERIIPISKELFGLMELYNQERNKLSLESIYFFVLKNGRKLYPKFVYRKINFYLGNVTDVDKKSPHVLRHTFATHMLNNGAGLETLKELLGHANLSATQVYTHNSFTQITNIYSQAHPRGRKTN